MPQTPTREDAFALLKQYNKSDSLIRHGLAVEGVMRYLANKRDGKDIGFRSKHEQSVAMLCEIGVYAYPQLSFQKKDKHADATPIQRTF